MAVVSVDCGPGSYPVTAFLAVLASVAVVFSFLTAVLGLLSQRAARQAAREAAATAGKVQEISVNVDGRLSEMIDRQAQLLGALHASGTPVPDRPEKTEPDTSNG
jgi:hypothetical protein